MKKKLLKILIGLVALVAIVLLGAFTFLQRAEFGGDPDTSLMARSSNYANGEFHYPIPTSVIAEGQSGLSITFSDLTHPVDKLEPAQAIPALKLYLKGLNPQQDTLVWLGHSSYFIQLAGRRMLVDPLFKPNAGPGAGFVLESDKRRILLSGDTGYGPHFKEIGKRFGSFDLVALDMGQYDPRWPTIHMNPEEASQAAQELNAKALLPAHVARFNLARHPWDEPFDRINSESKNKPYRLLTPQIGEAVNLGDEGQQFSSWWAGVR